MPCSVSFPDASGILPFLCDASKCRSLGLKPICGCLVVFSYWPRSGMLSSSQAEELGSLRAAWVPPAGVLAQAAHSVRSSFSTCALGTCLWKVCLLRSHVWHLLSSSHFRAVIAFVTFHSICICLALLERKFLERRDLCSHLMPSQWLTRSRYTVNKHWRE